MNNARIAIILPNLNGGGVERLSLLLGGEFERRGFGVDLVLQRAIGPLLAEVPASWRLVDFDRTRLRAIVIPLAQYLRRSNPDAVLAAMWPLTGLTIISAGISGFEGRVLLSEHVHLSSSPALKGLRSLVHHVAGAVIYRRAAAVVAVSRGVEADLVARTGLEAERTHVIYNPARAVCEADRVAQLPVAPAWARHTGPRLIAVGSLKPQKDYPLLLRAFATVRARTNARLLVLGDGAERSKLEALSHELGLDGVVDMPGFVPSPYPYLLRADLFLLSSAWEGFGNVIVEALACGTPVVSTDCRSGPREILSDGRYGRLVPTGDADALAEAIMASLAETHDKRALIARSRDFSVEKAADAYLDLLVPAWRAMLKAPA